jgi:hypothetical protein
MNSRRSQIRSSFKNDGSLGGLQIAIHLFFRIILNKEKKMDEEAMYEAALLKKSAGKKLTRDEHLLLDTMGFRLTMIAAGVISNGGITIVSKGDSVDAQKAHRSLVGIFRKYQ